MAKSESILSDFHEDKVKSVPDSPPVKPKADLDGSQVTSEAAPENPSEKPKPGEDSKQKD